MKRFTVAGGLMMLAFAGVALADDKALKELEGAYTVIGLEKGGKPAPKEIMDTLKVSIKGEVFVITIGTDEKKAKIKVDASKTPNTIDISPTDGPEKGMTFPGIYKIEKGEVTIVFHEKGTERPKEFKSEGEGMLMKLKKTEEKK
ncbi:MAG: TIGR03067 domain-containing protein [Planctomycetes bacterium]|nr:TIGR03067 domain-containing protein [Planctomycetota bacterium]